MHYASVVRQCAEDEKKNQNAHIHGIDFNATKKNCNKKKVQINLT